MATCSARGRAGSGRAGRTARCWDGSCSRSCRPTWAGARTAACCTSPRGPASTGCPRRRGGPCCRPDRPLRYYDFVTTLSQALAERILVLDGAMGTMIQAQGLGPDDFGGPQYEGCNELLNLTRPDVIRGIHAAYLEAGAEVISTNSFGCAPYVLAEYGLAERAHEITLAGARLAREAAGDRFVLGAMGPSTRSISVTRNV